ncbi:hypothetical protein REPUB_Repub10bG0007800 [Reevesia pubescens]
MEACCREDLVRPAKRLWDEMFASGCPGNLNTYNILIGKLSQIGEVEEALRLFQHMAEKRDVMLAQSILSTFVIHLCIKGQFLVASKLLCDLTSDIKDSDSHVVLLKCLADAKEIQFAINTYNGFEKPHLQYCKLYSPNL